MSRGMTSMVGICDRLVRSSDAHVMTHLSNHGGIVSIEYSQAISSVPNYMLGYTILI